MTTWKVTTKKAYSPNGKRKHDDVIFCSLVCSLVHPSARPTVCSFVSISPARPSALFLCFSLFLSLTFRFSLFSSFSSCVASSRRAYYTNSIKYTTLLFYFRCWFSLFRHENRNENKMKTNPTLTLYIPNRTKWSSRRRQLKNIRTDRLEQACECECVCLCWCVCVRAWLGRMFVQFILSVSSFLLLFLPFFCSISLRGKFMCTSRLCVRMPKSDIEYTLIYVIRMRANQRFDKVQRTFLVSLIPFESQAFFLLVLPFLHTIIRFCWGCRRRRRHLPSSSPLCCCRYSYRC